VKEVVAIDLGDRAGLQDTRSSVEFAAYRHRIWELLHDEVSRAQQQEKEVVGA
jgi:NitT/TauT family transport system ATP-binding protein